MDPGFTHGEGIKTEGERKPAWEVQKSPRGEGKTQEFNSADVGDRKKKKSLEGIACRKLELWEK